MAVLIWIMIYPMMIKVDFKSVKYISKNPKGLFVTWIVNWLIKPFTMYGIACLFFFVLFRAFIPVELATEYLAGAVLLGAAPCTAMVFVWSSLTQGNPVYTVVQVATNDIIILFAFGPTTDRHAHAEEQQNNQPRHALFETGFERLVQIFFAGQATQLGIIVAHRVIHGFDDVIRGDDADDAPLFAQHRDGILGVTAQAVETFRGMLMREHGREIAADERIERGFLAGDDQILEVDGAIERSVVVVD